MKIFYLVFCFFLSGLIYGQYNIAPEDQWFFKVLTPSLVSYDSIAVSNDTGSNFSAFLTASVQWDVNDSSKIGSMTLSYQGTPSANYIANNAGGVYSLYGLDLSVSPADTFDLTVVRRDVQGRDSVRESYWKNSGKLDQSGSTIITYNANTINAIYGRTDPLNLTDTITYTVFYRSQGRLDSAIQYKYSTNQPAMRIVNDYQGQLHKSIKTFSFDPNTGGYLLISEFRLRHNALGEVNEARVYSKVGPGSGLMLIGDVQYFERTIGLKEGLPFKKASDISLFPNPASHVLRVAGGNRFSQYEILDLQGKVVDEGRLSSENTIDIKILNPGLYIINLNDKKKGGLSLKFKKL